MADGWGTLIVADGHEMVMRDTLENVIRRHWEWGTFEIEILRDNNQYIHAIRDSWTDTDGLLWTGFVTCEDSEFPKPGFMLNRNYVPQWHHA